MRDIVGKMLAATVCQSPEQQRREIVKDNNALRKSLAKAEGAIKRRDELIELFKKSIESFKLVQGYGGRQRKIEQLEAQIKEEK